MVPVTRGEALLERQDKQHEPTLLDRHLATMQQFGLSAELVPLKSIPAVFEEVEKGKALYGVVPVENSTEGIVDFMSHGGSELTHAGHFCDVDHPAG